MLLPYKNDLKVVLLPFQLLPNLLPALPIKSSNSAIPCLTATSRRYRVFFQIILQNDTIESHNDTDTENCAM